MKLGTTLFVLIAVFTFLDCSQRVRAQVPASQPGSFSQERVDDALRRLKERSAQHAADNVDAPASQPSVRSLSADIEARYQLDLQAYKDKAAARKALLKTYGQGVPLKDRIRGRQAIFDQLKGDNLVIEKFEALSDPEVTTLYELLDARNTLRADQAAKAFGTDPDTIAARTIQSVGGLQNVRSLGNDVQAGSSSITYNYAVNYVTQAELIRAGNVQIVVNEIQYPNIDRKSFLPASAQLTSGNHVENLAISSIQDYLPLSIIFQGSFFTVGSPQ